MTKELTRNITSYDLLKMLAVLLMFVDHIGDYFFHDELWIRVIGRFCVPMWFFLIGYARSRDLGFKIWIWMALLAVSDVVCGQGLFAVNILATMILIRLSIDAIMERTANDQSAFWGISVILLCLSIPSSFFFEYGTIGFLIAIYGYWVRARQDGEQRYGQKITRIHVQTYLMFSAFFFSLVQYMSFGFSHDQFVVLSIGIFLVMLMLGEFKMAELPKLTNILPAAFVWVVQLFGRRTMEIYAVHLILLNFIVLYLGIRGEDFELFRFTFFPYGVAEDLGYSPK